MRESTYQAELAVRLRQTWPGTIVVINDPSRVQGFPDLLILHGDTWAALEVKMSRNSPQQPNQEYYITELGKMSYASFIYPENEEQVFNELQRAFGSRR